MRQYGSHPDRRAAASPKKQWEIARDVGYEKPNIITMFKQGVSRVPVEKVAPFAISLGADLAELLLLWLGELAPWNLRPDTT